MGEQYFGILPHLGENQLLLYFVLFGVLFYVLMGLFDRVIVPVINAFVTGRLPEKAMKQKEMEFADIAYVTFNKCVTTLFLWHCIRVGLAYCDLRFDDHEILVQALKQSLWQIPVIFFFYDFWYTVLHWALHWPWLYPLIHKHHHRQLVPFRGNIDAINVHPIEYILGEYNHLFSVFMCHKFFGGPGSIHGLTFILYILLAGTMSSLNHTRTDFSIPYVYQVWWHDYHHRQPLSNFGQYTMFWDWVFGWYFPRSVDKE